jgi:hypothetical protein
VVVVGVKPTVISIEFVHTPTEVTLIIVVPSGTADVVYPACKADADTFVSNGGVYPPTFEERLKGPASPPIGNTNVINVVMLFYYYYY